MKSASTLGAARISDIVIVVVPFGAVEDVIQSPGDICGKTIIGVPPVSWTVISWQILATGPPSLKWSSPMFRKLEDRRWQLTFCFGLILMKKALV